MSKKEYKVSVIFPDKYNIAFNIVNGENKRLYDTVCVEGIMERAKEKAKEGGPLDPKVYAKYIVKIANEKEIKFAEVFIRGVRDNRREILIDALKENGLEITKVTDLIPLEQKVYPNMNYHYKVKYYYYDNRSKFCEERFTLDHPVTYQDILDFEFHIDYHSDRYSEIVECTLESVSKK